MDSSTISGNTAVAGAGGIALFYVDFSLRCSTVTGNVADADNNGFGLGGGIAVSDLTLQRPLTVRSSIVAGNRLGSGTASDCRGPIASQGSNLWGDQTTCPNNGGAGDRNLVALGKTIAQTLDTSLADNGGPTKTHALVPGSPAIDLIPGGAACPATDQRGAARPQGAACDSGAVESGAAAPRYCAAFADVPASHPACAAIAALGAAGVVQGYGTIPPSFGPDDPVQRAQVAAFLVRALQWQGRPTGPRAFTDFGGLVGELRTASLILANACDSAGCVAQGYGDGRFGPNDRVSQAQVIAFVARTFGRDSARGWVPQPGGAPPYTGVPAVHDTDVRTYHRYAGAIPSAPTSAVGWNAPAPREWVARVLYQALQSAQ